MNCSMCEVPEKYIYLEIKTTKFWRVELNCRQPYLGWCLVILNRHVEDLFDITQEEREELFLITRKLRDVLKELFTVTKFNYSSLGNKVSHLHLQVIPRYDHSVTFEGIEFVDKRWGHNYKPYDKEFSAPEDIMEKIVREIRAKYI
jgi:diadenosine tetraphosphate (Ap4A) HIT family hydrolase